MPLEKEIFITGRYLQYFSPDDIRNPFFKIYQQKKQDTVALVNESDQAKTILDIGGGMGRLSLALTKSKTNRIFLADISVDMLKRSKNHAFDMTHLKLINTDAQKLPFQNSSFDYVIGLDLLCHLSKPDLALGEFNRVMKKKGLLILDSTNNNPLWALFYPRYLGKNPANWVRILWLKGVYPGWQTIVKHYSKKVFFLLLHNAGFRVLQCLNYGPAICPKWHLALAEKMP